MSSNPPRQWASPLTLSGRHVTLEPLCAEHSRGLQTAVADGELWRLWFTSVPRPEQVDDYIQTALAGQAAGTDVPFVVRDAAGDIVGSTRFLHIDQANQRLEIGYTWYSGRVQRTAVNSEAKLLLLGHAFEKLQAIAVEFRTNWFNHRSRAAIARLGAKQDGVLRQHLRMPGGEFRDTVVFSIIDSEWPAVKLNLQHQLGMLS